jgi:2-methylcitrate dehydratase PrpD
MTELLRLIKEHNIQAKDVASVKVGTNHNMPNALIHHKPQNELQAKFSMEFCMAILLIEGRAGLSEFTDEVVLRPDVQELISRIDFGVDDEAERAGFHKMTTILTINMKDGKVIRGIADFGRGSPAIPMSYDEVADKFRENCQFAQFSSSRAEEVIKIVRSIESLKSIKELTALLAI